MRNRIHVFRAPPIFIQPDGCFAIQKTDLLREIPQYPSRMADEHW